MQSVKTLIDIYQIANMKDFKDMLVNELGSDIGHQMIDCLENGDILIEATEEHDQMIIDDYKLENEENEYDSEKQEYYDTMIDSANEIEEIIEKIQNAKRLNKDEIIKQLTTITKDLKNI